MSDANGRTRTSIAAGLLPAFLFALGACSVVPDWSARETREFRITAHYVGGDTPRAVSLPSSNEHLMILELDVRPGELHEVYRDASRHMVLPSGDDQVRLDCRYRVFRQHAPDGSPLPWIEPRELFPGAARIEHHD